MTLEVLLLLSLALNCLSLIVSFYTIRRFKKIAKLSSLIYDQLVITRPLTNGPADAEFDFNHTLSKHLQFTETEGGNTDKPLMDDPLLATQEEIQLPEEKNPVKVMTKAESHLVKVLQAKYSLNDEEGPQPAGR